MKIYCYVFLCFLYITHKYIEQIKNICVSLLIMEISLRQKNIYKLLTNCERLTVVHTNDRSYIYRNLDLKYIQNAYTEYIYKIHIQNAYTEYIYRIHIQNTYSEYIYRIHIQNTYTECIYRMHIQNIYTSTVFSEAER